MRARDFVYWLQGYFEILNATSNRDSNEGALSSGQVECVRKHLNMVFKHEIDPGMGSAAHQADLTAIHAGQITPTKLREVWRTAEDTARESHRPVLFEDFQKVLLDTLAKDVGGRPAPLPKSILEEALSSGLLSGVDGPVVAINC